MSQKKKILFMAEAVTLAHVARPLALARMLDPHQYDVFFAASPDYHRFVGPQSFTVQGIRSINTKDFLSAIRKASPFYTTEILSAYVKEDLQLIDDKKPDLIVGDFRLSLSISAKLRHIPFANITNFYWSPYSLMKFTCPDILPARIFGQTLTNLFFPLIFPLVSASLSKPINQTKKKYGIPSLSNDIRITYTEADYTLYADFPALVPHKPLPPNHLYVGPILWSPDIPKPDWWLKIPKDLPIVYVNLGSSGQHRDLPLILDAISELPVTVVAATTGNPYYQTMMSNLPSNVFLSQYISNLDAASIASLAVTHGGSSSSHVFLKSGIPVIGISSLMDQELSIRSIENYGAGVHIRSKHLSKKKIQTSVMEMLKKPKYKKSAQKLADESIEYDPKIQFPKFVSKVLTTENYASTCR